MEILETFPRVFCFRKSRINENGGKSVDNLSVQTKIGNVGPLIFQLKSTWDEASEDEKEVCIEKGCGIVCEITATKTGGGDELLQSCVQLSDLETECASGDSLALIQQVS